MRGREDAGRRGLIRGVLSYNTTLQQEREINFSPQALAPSTAAFNVEGEVTTNVVVPHSKAGKVVEAVTKIRDTSGAAVSILELTGAPERTVKIEGQFAAVHAAFSLVINYIVDLEGDQCVKIAVTNDDAGGLIGKAGSVINELRGLLVAAGGGAQNCLQVDPADPAQPDQRIVTFTGSIEMCRRGHELVCEKVLDRRKQKGSAGYGGRGERMAGSGPDRGGGGGGGGGPRPIGGPNVVDTQVQVPNDRVGNVIGRAGARINEIRQLSGAKINIDTATPGNPNRLVTITGTPEQTQWAQYMISVAMAGGEPGAAMGGGTVQQTGYSNGADPYAGYGGSGSGGGSGGSGGAQGAPVHVQVPNDTMGNVIGRAGANINHIRQVSVAGPHSPSAHGGGVSL